MKRFAFIAIFASAIMCGNSSLVAQETHPSLDSLNQLVKEEIKILQTRLEASNDYETEVTKKSYIEFTLDTARIESLLSKRMEVDYSTLGMVFALNDAEAEYDKLLNNYYQAVSKKLSEEDRKILKETQNIWIKFRDNEIKLARTLAKEEYSGGGSRQNLILAMEFMEITKKRAIELFDHFVGIIAD